MPDERMRQAHAVQAVMGYATTQYRSGVAPEAIREHLIKRGMRSDDADAVVRRLERLKRTQLNPAVKVGQINMLIGGLICAAGTTVTVVTMMDAFGSEGGGHYIVAWGAIVFGGMQFFRGLVQALGH
ncbi:hypothetical protein HED60_16365 [Planctomycetales bacterium ZRK34]|nr:hypothetical protein HED60_16365 [Planctomycetales bacterium ZRK34]